MSPPRRQTQQWKDLRVLTEMYQEGLKAARKFRMTAEKRMMLKGEMRAVKRMLDRMDQLEQRGIQRAPAPPRTP